MLHIVPHMLSSLLLLFLLLQPKKRRQQATASVSTAGGVEFEDTHNKRIRTDEPSTEVSQSFDITCVRELTPNLDL